MTKEWNQKVEAKITRFFDYQKSVNQEVRNKNHSAVGSICRIAFRNAAFRPTALYRSICRDLGLKPNTQQEFLRAGNICDPNWKKMAGMAYQNGNIPLADKIEDCISEERQFIKAGWGNMNRSPIQVFNKLKMG